MNRGPPVSFCLLLCNVCWVLIVCKSRSVLLWVSLLSNLHRYYINKIPQSHCNCDTLLSLHLCWTIWHICSQSSKPSPALISDLFFQILLQIFVCFLLSFCKLYFLSVSALTAFHQSISGNDSWTTAEYFGYKGHVTLRLFPNAYSSTPTVFTAALCERTDNGVQSLQIDIQNYYFPNKTAVISFQI